MGSKGGTGSELLNTQIPNAVAQGPIAAIACKQNGTIVWMNAAAANLLRVDARACVGRHLRDVARTDEEKWAAKAAQEGWLSRQRHLMRADGSTVWVTISAEQRDGLFIYFFVDVDVLVKDQEDLAYQESIWRQAIVAAGYGVWDFDAATGRRFFSRGWKKIRGIPEDEEISDTHEAWLSRLHPEDIPHVLEEAQKHDIGEIKEFSYEYRERRRDGQWVWVLSRGRAFERDRNGRPVRMTGTDVDITQIKNEELVRAREKEEIYKVHLRELRAAHRLADAAREEADRISRTDPLTRLPNRRAFASALSELSTTRKKPFAVVLVDLDRFKPVNDLHGHAVGDQLLCAIAQRMKAICPRDALIARLGGDEFGIIVPAGSNRSFKALSQFATDCAQELIEALNKRFALNEVEVDVGTSIGIALFPKHGKTGEDVFGMADLAMYHVKQNGRGHWYLFDDELGRSAQQRSELEASVKQAIAEGEIKPYFQPIVDLRTGETVTFEVLARWFHPKFGAVPPDRFIPIIEQSGLVTEFSNLIFRSACRSALDWPRETSLSVNVSAGEICDNAFPARLMGLLAETGFPPSRLKVEITEQALVRDFDIAKRVVAVLREAGVKVMLDDFGTGYSGLGYLRELDLDCIKIDQSFASTLVSQEQSRKIFGFIQLLAERLGIETVSEGIEDERTRKAAMELGATLGQGYLFAPALPAREVLNMLSAARKRSAKTA